MKQPIGIYIHWPFCESKCPYCDFSTYVTNEPIPHNKWLQAYAIQLRHFFNIINTEDYELVSIFFGGGTPSLMDPTTVREIISLCQENIEPSESVEVTIESNPSSIEASKFAQFKEAGINRVSIGVQSLDDANLQWLGRKHSAQEALSAINIAKEVFSNYSIDIIYGLKGQSPGSWANELSEIVEIAGPHLSMYSLTIEDGTKFGQLHRKNMLTIPVEQETEDMFFLTHTKLTSKGFSRYEVSNYARNGAESKHNMLYWRYNDFIGIGPSAAGRFKKRTGERVATKNVCNALEWLQIMDIATLSNSVSAEQTQAIGMAYEEEVLGKQTQLQELIMMGMRIVAGIDTEDIYRRLGIRVINPQTEGRIQSLQKHGLIMLNGHTLRPTRAGMDRANAISHFLF